MRNHDGAAQGTESAEEPTSITPSSDAKPDDVGILSDRWMGLETQEKAIIWALPNDTIKGISAHNTPKNFVPQSHQTFSR